MGLIGSKVERSEIKAGDHIYSYRAGSTYSHHGIFVGGGKVVHLTARHKENSRSDTFVNFDNELSDLPSLCPTFPDCGFRQPDNGVALICLDHFLQHGSLYRYDYGVTPFVHFTKVRGGTCTIAISDPPNEVVDRAMYLHRNGFEKYDVCRNNCEDFALYCKTRFWIIDSDRVGKSGQASSVIGTLLVALLCLPLKSLMSTHVGLATVTAGMIGMSRYATDMGVRSDAIKVDAEELALNLGRGYIDEKNGEKMRALKRKLYTNIGVQSDVIKVAVEELVENIGWGEIDEKNGEKMRALESKLPMDIGVLIDVLKVAAEELVENHGWEEIDEKNGVLATKKKDEKYGEKMRALESKLFTDVGVLSDVLKVAAEYLAVNLEWGEIDEKYGEKVRALKSKLSTDLKLV